MKHLLLLITTSFTLFSWSQQLTASISSGYQFGVGKQNLEHHSVQDFLNWTPWVWEQVDVSLGKGVITNVALGYNFNENYAFEVRGSYLFGTEFSSRVEYPNITYERLLSGTMWRINPSFSMSVGKAKLRPYASIGFILGVGKVNFTYQGHSPDTIHIGYKYEYDGGLSFGASAAFGFNYQLSDKICLFGEFNFISQSYAPKKGRLTEYIVDNENLLDQVPDYPYNLEIEFVEELQTDPTITPVPDEPMKRAKHSYPFHSYGLNVGVKFTLWTKKKEESGTP